MMKHPRIHNERHLDFIRSLPCIITGDNVSVEAAHIRFSDMRAAKRKVGIGEKPDDIWTLPLSSEMHRKQHAMNERRFWQQAGIDPIFCALALYAVSGDYERGCQIVRNVSFRVWMEAGLERIRNNPALAEKISGPAPELHDAAREEEIAKIIELARKDFHRDGPAKSLEDIWSRKAARAILSRLRPTAEWQPMETAPRGPLDSRGFGPTLSLLVDCGACAGYWDSDYNKFRVEYLDGRRAEPIAWAHARRHFREQEPK